jgi:hypothetical protein
MTEKHQPESSSSGSGPQCPVFFYLKGFLVFESLSLCFIDFEGHLSRAVFFSVRENLCADCRNWHKIFTCDYRSKALRGNEIQTDSVSL